jgi:8-oxo-dGTP pyrophosphatase MutT (NUDIX family)
LLKKAQYHVSKDVYFIKGYDFIMTRLESLHVLYRYSPACDAEQRFKDDMILFLSTYENCYERTLTIGHFTASAWLINKAGDKALLTHHAKLNQWFQLGGHCDGNPNTLEVAFKEAQEESGIHHIVPVSIEIFDIDIHLIPENKKEKAHYHYDIRYLLQVMSDEEIVVSTESHALDWFSKDRNTLPQVNASVMRMFNKWISI